MKLVNNAHRAWRWFSMQCMALAAVTTQAFDALPVALQTVLPNQPTIVTALLVLGIVGRMVDQTGDK